MSAHQRTEQRVTLDLVPADARSIAVSLIHLRSTSGTAHLDDVARTPGG